MADNSSIYNWLSQNGKIAKMTGVKTYNWGIPAYKSSNGFKTCPNAAACVAGCYAKSGAYLFSNVAKVFEKRLKLAQSSRFVNIMNAEIRRRKVERLRIHDSGDFFSQEYVNSWLSIIRANPQCTFYAYTKMVSLFKQYAIDRLIPNNFIVIYSYGGTEDKLIDKVKDRHSWVFSSIQALQAAGYADAHVNDAVALEDNPKIGLVYHGVKSYANTNWDKVKDNTAKAV